MHCPRCSHPRSPLPTSTGPATRTNSMKAAFYRIYSVERHVVAFIEVSGAPVELMQIDHVARPDL